MYTVIGVAHRIRCTEESTASRESLEVVDGDAGRNGLNGHVNCCLKSTLSRKLVKHFNERLTVNFLSVFAVNICKTVVAVILVDFNGGVDRCDIDVACHLSYSGIDSLGGYDAPKRKITSVCLYALKLSLELRKRTGTAYVKGRVKHFAQIDGYTEVGCRKRVCIFAGNKRVLKLSEEFAFQGKQGATRFIVCHSSDCDAVY